MDEVKAWLKVTGFARKFAEKLERCAELEKDPNTTKEEKSGSSRESGESV